jgi:hypothetical protein
MITVTLLLLWPGILWPNATQGPAPSSIIRVLEDTKIDDCKHQANLKATLFPSTITKDEVLNVSGRTLQVQGGKVDAIWVTTWDNSSYSLKLCAEVSSANENLTADVLSKTGLREAEKVVSIVIPEAEADRVVATALIVKAPRDAELTVQLMNGKISLNGFLGAAKIRTTNGEISATKSSSSLELESENGGITIWDCSGDVHATTSSGGITLILPDRWEGKGVRAYTRNGGLTIAMAKDLHLGLEILGPPYLAVTCSGSACGSAKYLIQDRHKIVRLGLGDPQIHADVINGAVTLLDRH